MANSNPAAVVGAPIPVLDLSGYKQITIVKTGDVDGHTYKRGQRPTVDAETLKALLADGLIAAGA